MDESKILGHVPSLHNQSLDPRARLESFENFIPCQSYARLNMLEEIFGLPELSVEVTLGLVKALMCLHLFHRLFSPAKNVL